MKDTLHHISLKGFKAPSSGKTLDLPLSYQLFGRPLLEAPVVLVNHALTGNSDVAGKKGWWRTLIGKDRAIDTSRVTVLCFNIPGNGYNGFFIEDYEDFTPGDIAAAFIFGLEQLKIGQVEAIIGGSVGGAIGWEMLAQKPDLTKFFIPVATDYKTSDWLHSQCLVQKFLLNTEHEPLEKARIHAMLCYRTPESLNVRFNNEFDTDKGILKSHDWLNYHGRALNERFSLKAYRLMNHLLMTINADIEKIRQSKAEIHLIAVDTDLFFPAFEMKNALDLLRDTNRIFYHEINSAHGHDAFLIESRQITEILTPILTNYDRQRNKYIRPQGYCQF